jgi:hypothetical protein
MTSAHGSTAVFRLRWEDDELEFEVADAGRLLRCSISREALEDAGPGPRASRWQLRDVFDRLSATIVRIVLKKSSLLKPGVQSAIHVSTDDLNLPPTAPVAAMAAARAQATG